MAISAHTCARNGAHTAHTYVRSANAFMPVQRSTSYVISFNLDVNFGGGPRARRRCAVGVDYLGTRVLIL